MEGEGKKDGARPGISTIKLAAGAAGLLLFIIGVKRSFRLGDVSVEDSDTPPVDAVEPAEYRQQGAAEGREHKRR